MRGKIAEEIADTFRSKFIIFQTPGMGCVFEEQYVKNNAKISFLPKLFENLAFLDLKALAQEHYCYTKDLRIIIGEDF